ncbi:transketolase [Acidithiobacillus sp. HP-11]|uniref:transketolase n=1 Tax=Acidithiobacillus sp. HP-11 TaxID=2697656 RepID=UPI00187A7D6C|nr:transketolase [Acidithiobacillus sp. HP-11]MBE7565747.1 transketolase [Acidithiobacillus sp. HP-11]
MNTTQDLARNIRINALKMVHKAKASHIASALSIADILAVLYGQIMTFDSSNPKSVLRDRFILSKGHSCVAVYSALAEIGFIQRKQLETYGEDHSWLMNHISHKVPGVEFSTGSLGHGLPFGTGKALAAKILGQHFRTFVLLSDGEMDEGSNWEALMFAAHHQLSSLVAIIDYNKLQSLGTVSSTIELEPLNDKLTSFGWNVREIDGHDHGEIVTALSPAESEKPVIVIAHTTKGKGVSFMENRVEWHYKNPNDEQLTQALKELEGERHA